MNMNILWVLMPVNCCVVCYYSPIDSIDKNSRYRMHLYVFQFLKGKEMWYLFNLIFFGYS